MPFDLMVRGRGRWGFEVDLERAPGPRVETVTYGIAHAAQHSGLSIDTLRYYERIGLMEPPVRDSAGRRTYTDDDVAWLVFLTRLRTTGMPLKVVREYVRLRRLGAAGVPAMRRILVDQRAALQARMDELRSCMDLLDYKIEKYGRLERESLPPGAPEVDVDVDQAS
jgi:DNA-binding transcriptional MerR regulator